MKTFKEHIIEKTLAAKRESKYIEFKESFDTDSNQDWCENIKDIIAIANSGGGIIVYGLKNNGTVSNFNSSKLFKLDTAIFNDKISKYIEAVFCNFEIVEIKKDKSKLVGLVIEDSRIPFVFCKPGTYALNDRKQKNAFSQGTIYFRHGAKSEPCNSTDLKDVIERNLELIKKSWLGNIRKVVNAPSDSRIEVLSSKVTLSNAPNATPIRITNDISAPSYRLEDPNITHPYRQKDVLNILQKDLKIKLNSFHFRCVRKEYKIDGSRPDMCWISNFGSPQFSSHYVNFLKEEFKKDNKFFDKIREKYLKR